MTRAARSSLWILLLATAAVRILLQTAVLPPYAGMDEIYHVARLVFVQNESRNPSIAEPSIPRYLERSVRQTAGWQPAFGVIGERWPDVVRSGARPEGIALDESLRRSYSMPNYEAQHPSLYYTVAALAAPRASDLDALRAWRLLSAAFAVAIVMVVGFIGWRVAGPWGILAAALLPSLPTWQALVARASNDAFACLLLAVAVAATFAAPRGAPGVLEGLAWGGAVAAKLYSWPAAILLPLVWRWQRASARRIITVLVISGAALAATLWDLGSRTRNPIGIFAFDPVATAAAAAPPIAWGEALKTFALTFAWTSGQHWNALTPVGLALFLVPLAVLAVAGLARLRGRESGFVNIVAITAGVFAVAQAVKFFAYLRSARLEGLALPAGGKEGWYWYALAPLFVGVLLALILRALRPRLLAVLFVAWVAIWDVTLHEGALFRDFAGWTSPAARGMLVRWGSLAERPATDLTTMAVGPFAEGAFALRAAHLLLLAAIAAMVLRRDEP